MYSQRVFFATEITENTEKKPERLQGFSASSAALRLNPAFYEIFIDIVSRKNMVRQP